MITQLKITAEGKFLMKELLAITDKDVTGSDTLSSAKPRIAVGIVLFDDNKNIALSHIGIWDLHGLPGGGVDEGEDFITAVKREAWEEAGCQCEIIREIGMTYQNSAVDNFVQEKFHYLAKVVGEKGDLHLEDYEIASQTTVRWYPLKQAMQIISERKAGSVGEEFFKRRDIAVLNEVISSSMIE